MSTQTTSIRGFLRLPDVLKLIPVSRATWYAGIKDGRFPAPIKISPNIAAWKASDIHQLIEVLSSAGQE